MILISVVISIIFQKNRSCTNKIRVIYFCLTCVNLLPENVQFFIYFIYYYFFSSGGEGATDPLPPLAQAPMSTSSFMYAEAVP